MQFNIAFLGYTAAQTRAQFRNFVEDNIEQVEHYDPCRGVARLTDGTEIICITSPARVWGRKFDQIMLVDDARWNIIFRQGCLIKELQRRAAGSIVPEAFRIIFYDLDWEEGKT